MKNRLRVLIHEALQTGSGTGAKSAKCHRIKSVLGKKILRILQLYESIAVRQKMCEKNDIFDLIVLN
jgi:hypothetical protein